MHTRLDDPTVASGADVEPLVPPLATEIPHIFYFVSGNPS